MSRRLWILACALVTVVSVARSTAGASLDESLANAESRRKAAENGLREIRARVAAQAEPLRAVYGVAAERNNAWVEAMCSAIEKGVVPGPDVAGMAEPAAAALMEWVAGRNKALGLPEVSGANLEAVRRQITQNLTDIVGGAARATSPKDAGKRKQTAGGLRERLQWKAFDDVR